MTRFFTTDDDKTNIFIDATDDNIEVSIVTNMERGKTVKADADFLLTNEEAKRLIDTLQDALGDMTAETISADNKERKNEVC